MYKIKTLWYHYLNRGLHTLTKSKQDNEKFIWKIILDESFDDYISFVSERERERLESFANDFIKNLKLTASEMDKFVSSFFEENKEEKDEKILSKKFAQYLKVNKVSSDQSIYFQVFKNFSNLNINAFDVLVKFLSSSINQKIDPLRKFVGNIKFSEYELKAKEDAPKSFSEWH